MTNYYVEQNGVIKLFDTDKQKIKDTLLFMPELQGLEIKETQRPIVLSDDCSGFVFADTQQYQQEQIQKEQERINNLTLSHNILENEIYKQSNHTFNDIIYKLKGDLPENLLVGIKGIEIILNSPSFKRDNPYVDLIGYIVGLSKEDLNDIFDNNQTESI